MRTPEEQRLALDCLALALYNGRDLAEAARYYAFVTGEDADDAKRKLSAVQNALKS